jgi:surface polysaccharide O-acyltransferase-like enzyme
MTKFSIVLGVLGLFATGVVLQYLSRQVSNWRPRHYWLLGLMALLPAWLIAFLGLLPSSVGPERSPLPRSALLCSVTALFGVIFTEMAVRQLDKRGYSFCSFIYWLLGVAGLVPAWVLALWILL